MKKIILITGVSSGLGKCTAEYLAQKGHKVYGTTRKDTETDDACLTLLRMDVTDVSSVQQGIAYVLEQEGRLDVLINNAGMGYAGAIEDFSAEEARIEMNTNFYGVVNTIQAVLPAMRRQGGGMIININSIGGIMGLPFQGFYSASKFAVEGLSEALRMELRQFNIKIVQINPGDHQTQFTANRRMIVKTNDSIYKPQFYKTLAIIEHDEQNGLKTAALAKKINSIIQKKHPCTRYIVSSFEQKLAVFLKIILPGAWFSKILEGYYGIK